MALARFRAATDWVAGHLKAFGNNSGWIQAVTLVDDVGAAASVSTATSGNVASGATDSGNPVKVGGVYNVTKPTLTTGQRGDFQVTTRGMLGVTIYTENSTSAATVSTFSADGFAPSNGLYVYNHNAVFNGTNWTRQPGDAVGAFVVTKGATSGGLSAARVVTGTSGVIKASAGQLYTLASVQNTNAGVRYLHLYNKATAPTLSTDTPVLTIALAATSVQNAIDLTNIGVAFAAGIAWAYTTDNVAIPTTAATSTELMFSATYK